MAKANSTITFCGVTFSRDEVFGPSTLRAIYNKDIPRHFRVARDGSVPVLVVLRDLNKQGAIGLQRMIDESDIVKPKKQPR